MYPTLPRLGPSRVVGIGFICHMLPTGRVPSVTKVELRSSIVPFDIIIFELPANGIGVFIKHSSSNTDPKGHSLNCL